MKVTVTDPQPNSIPFSQLPYGGMFKYASSLMPEGLGMKIKPIGGTHYPHALLKLEGPYAGNISLTDANTRVIPYQCNEFTVSPC